MTVYEKRDSFTERLQKMDQETQSYFNELDKAITQYGSIKSRASLRCVTYRYEKKVIAKIAIGGKTLKLYLAIDPSTEMFKEGKFHPRDLSNTKAYEQVPSMLPIKSELAARKAKSAIQYLILKEVYHFEF